MATINMRVTKDSLGKGEFDCPKCGSSQPYEDTRKTTITSLFGLIPISTKAKENRKCVDCKITAELKATPAESKP
ncbi:MAG: hypothetical protein ABJG68_08580 [Crocinitomicaceae bacterium]